jgi:hypothetical protein
MHRGVRILAVSAMRKGSPGEMKPVGSGVLAGHHGQCFRNNLWDINRPGY